MSLLTIFALVWTSVFSLESDVHSQEPSTVYVLEVVLDALEREAGEAQDIDAMLQSTVTVIERRIGIPGSVEQVTTDDMSWQIAITVPPSVAREHLEQLLGIGPELEFRFHHIEPEPFEEWEEAVERSLKTAPIIEGSHLTGAQTGWDPWTDEPVVNMQFDKEGADRLATLSRDHLGASISILLDGEIISTATLNEPILEGSMRLSGVGDFDAANDLAIRLRSGALPVPFEIVEVRTVD